MEIMGRSRWKLPDGCSFHITLRWNSRACLIARGVRRDLLLAVLRKGQETFGFRLHGTCHASCSGSAGTRRWR